MLDEENAELKARVADGDDACTRLAQQLEQEREERAKMQIELDRHISLEDERREQGAQWTDLKGRSDKMDALEPEMAQLKGQMVELRNTCVYSPRVRSFVSGCAAGGRANTVARQVGRVAHTPNVA